MFNIPVMKNTDLNEFFAQVGCLDFLMGVIVSALAEHYKVGPKIWEANCGQECDLRDVAQSVGSTYDVQLIPYNERSDILILRFNLGTCVEFESLSVKQ